MSNDKLYLTEPPTPFGVTLMNFPEPPASSSTVELLRELLGKARTGQVTGLAVVTLHENGSFGLRLCGAATEEANQMGITGMLAALQKMTLELY